MLGPYDHGSARSTPVSNHLIARVVSKPGFGLFYEAKCQISGMKPIKLQLFEVPHPPCSLVDGIGPLGECVSSFC